MLTWLYGTIAEQRRRWYERHPNIRRGLSRPVISVGSLTVGGSGKTPIAAYVVSVLVSMGERPALLSRGYRRSSPVDGVVVVRDFNGVRSDLAHSGDEPLMMARSLQGASVLVSEDRYLAGRLAETKLGTTVHVLDDGFQHFSLERTLDLVVFGEGDTEDLQTLPSGRLRESFTALRRADALVIEGSDLMAVRRLADSLDVETSFSFSRELQSPLDAETQLNISLESSTRILAVAGIAKPHSFFKALVQSGYKVVDTLAFNDHHPFSRSDLVKIKRRLRGCGADYVVTTEKDLIRFLPHVPFDIPLAWVPLSVTVEPSEEFCLWLEARLNQARE